MNILPYVLYIFDIHKVLENIIYKKTSYILIKYIKSMDVQMRK